ncbi:MAG: T9SS type A sorting domain-containing protein [Flavobacteriales bacterium]|nr:T9SS type A sorting domain-containing protein [Flavobacteriales bacterium]
MNRVWACNMVQHGVVMPTYYTNSLPNHPNYFLGPVDGSVCDSLGINTLTPGPSPRERGVRVYPNPSHGAFTLSYPAQPTVGQLEIRDVAGRVVMEERIPQWSTVHQVELTGQATGMYQCKLTWAKWSVATHVILER